ncbi:formate dehydrogenase subunit alpha [Thermodesulfovibrionales bacterium]|nr:formate dehydrogenase subunit alpha [Thermodesulfovibrionales bacterium]
MGKETAKAEAEKGRPMATVRIVADGKEIPAKAGQTIFEACQESGIYIPTLCHDKQLRPLGFCWICAVDVQGRGLVPSCVARITDGMVLQTNNDKVVSVRRQRLDQLLFDHYGDCIAPCQDACPAGVDVQLYIALIARGAYREAVEVIKERLPLPAVIGRICHRPCEAVCRRGLVEEPISICSLKRFAADYEIGDRERFIPKTRPRSGSKVAIIGSGPAGLSAGYYLIQEGHEVTIFEALPKPGGMLRYGIPGFRLPKEILGKEIATITELGVVIKTNQTLGKDFTLRSLFGAGFHAIFLAIGAHQSQKMNIEGEGLEGVLPGTDFLRAVASGERVEMGRKVAVIGGGNTAIDAARTALRLGAAGVTIVYRRSRAEMPATEWEVKKAEEEGIKLHFLSVPIRVVGRSGRLSSIECIKMKLGEPGASGRRRPEPILGSEFALSVDSVIVAIGQKPDLSLLAEESGLKTERGNIVADTDTLLTGMAGVFAGGDCVNGAATAVEAIAAGKKAASAIDCCLKGEGIVAVKKPFNINKGRLNEEELVQVERKPRLTMPRLRPNERRSNFREIELGYPEDIAKREAERCLECGCKAVYDCNLRQLATAYEISPISDKRERYYYPVDRSHPFMERDPNKCIRCRRCVRICHKVQGVGALSLVYREGAAEGYSGLLLNTACESCGQCIDSCPVGALVSKNALPPTREVKTICPYCGCGCGIYIGVRGNIIVNVRGDPDSSVNKGNLCVKGRYGYDFINHPERLTAPLIRRDGNFVEVSWKEALDLVAARLLEIRDKYGPESLAGLSSAKVTNEENYLFQKLLRSLGTNSVDHCARLCHAATVVGLATVLGSAAMTNPISEVEGADAILVMGCNPTESEPIIGYGIRRAVRKGAKLIVIDPRRIPLVKIATLHLQIRPGTDIALCNALMHVILKEGLEDCEFIKSRTNGFENMKEIVERYTPEYASGITGVSGEDIVRAARIYATAGNAAIFYSMGVVQQTCGVENVVALTNLALATGNLGKSHAGINPLRGQCNVQGACDMGCLPNVFSGYQPVHSDMTTHWQRLAGKETERGTSDEIRAKFSRAWGVELSDIPGRTMNDMFNPNPERWPRAMYIMGIDPVLSNPNSDYVRQCLESLDFLVAQDIFLTETARYADVILPAASFAEKDGTFINTERRVQRVRKVIEPRGDSRADWEIIQSIAQRCGFNWHYSSPQQIWDEVRELTPHYFAGMSYERLESPEGLQWPCTSLDHPGTPIMHVGKFARGIGQFSAVEYRPLAAEDVSDEYPFTLTTSRKLHQFHMRSMTGKTEGLNQILSEERMEINTGDAKALGLTDDDVVEVTSRRGSIKTKIEITDRVPPGVVCMSFHFAETPTNTITNPAVCNMSVACGVKATAVGIRKKGSRGRGGI